ncbi:Ppx/GppA phosphatase family protein [uncultured Desulfovibrio sp.]|uniref:Ppx/GppA phosphatase family protein n=1 Tax=uncultured Desulfovibrio sp. TaxID=167968 RepID=UPI002624EE49|nr:Ppx/GppA phosphatase family protein [uncultured Desulfovibrio sp.]
MPGSITVDPRAVLEEKTIAIMDLGSNSLRLMLAHIKPDGSYAILNQVKHMVRLGEGSFQHGRLREESMARTIAVLRGMASMCEVYGVSETIAVATAAVRDASNGEEFLARVKDKTGLAFTAISGQEEARLIYLGVSSGLEHTTSLRLFIDIGGGSTELIVGSSDECRNLDSMKLGCVRLSNLFFDDGEKPVSPKRYAALQNYIRNSALHSFQRIADFTLTEAVGSSGTAQNLAEISAALDEADALRQGRKPVERRDLLSYAGLCRVVRELCSRTLKERKALPGINANRADVIIAGAAILQTIMEDQGFDSVRISNRNLQNGLLVDYITRRRPHKEGSFHPVRKESVLHLARKCGYEERHSRHVARLALDLFDSARALGLHALSPDLRELLHYAGLLHDIGIFISFSRHNVHSHYLIRNTELLGFTAREVELLAALAYFHRKRPTRKTPFYTELDDDMRAEVRPLSLFLLLAERMDKSHRQIIRAARFVQGDDGLLLRVNAADDCPIEMEQLRHSLKNIRKVFATREIALECRREESRPN